MTAYYNEIDPFAAQWLRNLIAAGEIAPGDVDERDIRDVVPSEVVGYTQRHWFAGIGGWSFALRRAGFPDDRPIDTASVPCQPFSQSGKHAGFDDERHLWPAMFHILYALRPEFVMGEQVASNNGLAWLDLVSTDMEGAGYTFRAADLCAAGFGAPHIRQRLYWMAHADNTGLQRRLIGRDSSDKCATGSGRMVCEWLPCRDGHRRPVEPDTFPLASGLPRSVGRIQPWLRGLVDLNAARRNRIGRLKGYGNAINIDTATAWILSL